MEINSKRIGKFLKSLNDSENIYLAQVIRLRDSINKLIKENDLTEEQVCDLFRIKPKEYEDLISGNRSYGLRDMANLNAAFIRLEHEKYLRQLEENVPVSVVNEENKNKEQ